MTFALSSSIPPESFRRDFFKPIIFIQLLSSMIFGIIFPFYNLKKKGDKWITRL